MWIRIGAMHDVKIIVFKKQKQILFMKCMYKNKNSHSCYTTGKYNQSRYNSLAALVRHLFVVVTVACASLYMCAIEFQWVFLFHCYSFTLQHFDYIDRETVEIRACTKRRWMERERKECLRVHLIKQQLKHKTSKFKQQSLSTVVIKKN